MKSILLFIAAASLLLAQKPFQGQSSSTISFVAKDDEKIVETHNVTYELTGDHVPSRPEEERLVLRKTRQEKQVLGDEGVEATTTLEVWPFGTDLKLKPLYALTLTGTDGERVDDALWVASRGTEELEWWSVYKLGNGAASLRYIRAAAQVFHYARDSEGAIRWPRSAGRTILRTSALKSLMRWRS